MDQVVSVLEQMTSGMAKVAQSDIVVGKPIVLGEVTIVPLSRVKLGMGGGGGEGEGDVNEEKKAKHGGGKGSGQFAGGGGKVRPVGIAVFTADGVEVLPIKGPKGAIDKALDKIPELVDLVKATIERIKKDD